MGFADRDAVLNAWTVQGRGQFQAFSKLGVTTAAGGHYTYWPADGIPSAGGYSGTALAAQQVTAATAGALSFTNAGGSRLLYLLEALIASSSSLTGTVLIWDRLLYYPQIDHTTTSTQTFDNTNKLPRYTSGAGVHMFLEVTTALGAIAQNALIRYTDQDGNTGVSTPQLAMIASSVARRIPHATLVFPLAAGDTGVREAEDITFSAANTAGESALVLAKLLGGFRLRDDPYDFFKTGAPPDLEDDCALMFTLIADNAVPTSAIGGLLKAIEG